MKRPVIAGAGCYLPPDVVTNDDLARRLDTSDAWIRTRTGMSERHVVDAATATADLAVEAGRRALESTGTARADVVVLATTTPDRQVPPTAPEIAHRLGLGTVPAFDLSAACAGFLYGLSTAAGMIATGAAEQVLLIGADAFTTMVDPEDRATVVLFGDAAGALVLRAGHAGQPGAIGAPVLGSDGSLADLIQVPAGGSRSRARGPLGELADPSDFYFRMNGRETFRHAVTRMSQSSRQAVEAAGWSLAQVDRLGAHQANARILAAVAEELAFEPARQLSNVAQVANTAAASLPTLLAMAAAEGTLKPGHRVLLTAFGGGLSWGAATLTWPEITPLVD
ncbi:3-oxoacyl-[acyl-carrier-protein] synthase 3 protein 3 [Streptomyces longispororuber]|uniref:Beta-ketoacyl-[acyl-carrier-protein] synthase III n=1 Tax=Streptomyces longispororuber TaxID=68230 RepID=A0A919AB46_9ACTN|nr:beta-ketoacyl-ACP synthase III [Streptomyces longispororuber]GHE94805.1 3-oxoacyl-[acyl-carrier-protein] synthase 3 protein 3 [Streptomyces longispororuber]